MGKKHINMSMVGTFLEQMIDDETGTAVKMNPIFIPKSEKNLPEISASKIQKEIKDKKNPTGNFYVGLMKAKLMRTMNSTES